MPTYRVETRATCYAVIRTGPKGGTKFITAYTMKHQAEEVAAILNRWAGQEV